MSKIIELNNNNFKAEVLDSKSPVLVDFWAPWCGPCLMMSPVLEELAEKYDNKIKFAKLNTEEANNQEFIYKYQIQSIPNLKIFNKGQIQKELVGYRPKEMLEEELSEITK